MYDRVYLLELLSIHRTIDENGVVFIPSNEVYVTISEAMRMHKKSICSPYHIYQILRKNRRGTLDFVYNTFGIKKISMVVTSKDLSLSEHQSVLKNHGVDFNLLIPKEDWKDMLQQKIYSDGRSYISLKYPWTEVFLKKIQEQTELVCSFSFYSVKFSSKPGSNYAKLVGFCSKCGADLKGVINLKPEKSEDTLFNCTVTNKQLNMCSINTNLLGESVDEAECSVKLPFFKNGSCCKAIKCSGKVVEVQETCAFDSLMQIVINGISTCESFKRKILNKDNRIWKFALKALGMKKVDVSLYEERAEILMEIGNTVEAIFTIRVSRKVHRLNAKCNAANLCEVVFQSFPSSITEYRCENCQYGRNNSSVTLPININIIVLNGMDYLQRAVDDLVQNDINRLQCPNCTEMSLKRTTVYGEHLIFDMSVTTDDGYMEYLKTSLADLKTSNQRSRQDNLLIRSATVDGKSEDDVSTIAVKKNFPLNSIPTIINISNNVYRIAGLISYNRVQEHYTSFIRQTKWKLYDDLKDVRIKAKDDKKVNPHVLYYVST